MGPKSIILTPYVHFEGNCEEALHYYSGILNGKVSIQSRYDNPAMKAPEHYKNKVLHGRLHFGDQAIFASDAFPNGRSIEKGSNMALSLGVDSPENGKIIFDKLASGGTVNIAFEKQFWGDWHGNLVDKYGIYWMVNFEKGY